MGVQDPKKEVNVGDITGEPTGGQTISKCI
jgi:hypothetical protein